LAGLVAVFVAAGIGVPPVLNLDRGQDHNN
jgi:hypothetical protein